MKSIRNSTEFTLRERGSKFYGFLFPCSSVLSFEKHLTAIKKTYPDATHHCSAYRVLSEQQIEFNSDDGEPSGSAGLPMLNTLRSFDLLNCGAVVVRYYGGSKLGKGGLIEAYGGTVEGCITHASIAEIQKVVEVRVVYAYHQENDIQFLVRSFYLKEKHSEFLEKVSKTFLCKADQETNLLESLEKLSYTGITFERIRNTFVMI